MPTAACWPQEKRDEGAKPTWFMSKETSVPQVNHSQYSSPTEALNLIVESKTLPTEVNKLTFELHLPRVEMKEKLAIILFCGFYRALKLIFWQRVRSAWGSRCLWCCMACVADCRKGGNQSQNEHGREKVQPEGHSARGSGGILLQEILKHGSS